MHISRVYLRWYKSFNIDYSGAVGGDRVKRQRPWNTYHFNGSDADLPFVEIPLEKDVTTIVGANESGKSHLLSAISNVIDGHSIPVDPFSSAKPTGREFSQTDLCHFALPLTKEAALWPQLGLEISGLSRADFKTITGAEPPAGEEHLTARLFLMPAEAGDEEFARVYHDHTEEPVLVSKADLTKIRKSLPQVFFINSQLPFADEVHLADLLKGYGEEADDEERYFDSKVLQEVGRELLEETIPTASTSGTFPTSFVNKVAEWQSAINDSSRRRAQQLELEVKLFRDILRIPKSALTKLFRLGEEAKSHAAALVDTWSQELERTLNLSRYWQQDQEFSIKLRYHRHVISFEISDKTNKTYTFKERSSGLRYFLSYYIQAKAIERLADSHAAVVLMDEPDSFLSIAGQRNLLAVFESLAQSKHTRQLQLVYTTHSPFLIHRNFPRRIRLVRKGDGEEGTQLVDKARERRFEPIRSALGIELSQTLFMGATNIVTEGPTDQYFLAEAIRYFAPEVPAAELINLNEVVIVSAQYASAVYKLIESSTWADEAIPTAIAILDFDAAGRTEQERLVGQKRNTAKLMDPERVITVDKVLQGRSGDATTEDIIPVSLFIAAIRHYCSRWLPELVASPSDDSSLLEPSAFECGNAAAARTYFNKLRGTTDIDYDKLGVMESLFDLLHNKDAPVSTKAKMSVRTEDVAQLKTRIVELCKMLRQKIEAGTRAQRQQTGVQAVKRLISDFFIQHQVTPPPTLDLELKLERLSAEAKTFGGEEAHSLLSTLSILIADAKSLRQHGRNELTADDWERWKDELEAIRKNPLAVHGRAQQPSLDATDDGLKASVNPTTIAGFKSRQTMPSSMDSPVHPSVDANGTKTEELPLTRSTL